MRTRANTNADDGVHAADDGAHAPENDNISSTLAQLRILPENDVNISSTIAQLRILIRLIHHVQLRCLIRLIHPVQLHCLIKLIPLVIVRKNPIFG